MKSKWNLRPLAWAAIALSAFLALQGCSSGPEKYSGGTWSNYKCTAASGGHKSIGWATSKGAAKRSALDKCRAHSVKRGSCRIVTCHGT